MKMAILGAGGIAGKMARTITKMRGVDAYAVASREYGKAKAFADAYGFAKAYGSYEEMLCDPQVELVYVATPHSHHGEHMKQCLEHGKHVLCEKAFTVNAAQAREVFTLAENRKLLVTEAMWTRYMPMRKVLDDVVASGVIGKATSLTANLGYPISHVERLINPALAGGALLDLGVYPINFALMVFGSDIREITSTVVKAETGVDAVDSITFTYADGRMAVLHSNMFAATDRKGMIFGDKGYIEVLNINNCEGIHVYDAQHKRIRTYETPEQITGYEYEVDSCRKALANGELECVEMPHVETLRVLHLMDSLRESWGIRYPME